MLAEDVHLNSTDTDSNQALIATAKREGIIACFCFAVIAWATNLLLPLFVQHTRSHLSKTEMSTSPPRVEVLGVPLSRIWQLSHLLFALSMFLTFLASSVITATVLVGVVGISWGVATWAPFALIGTEISDLKEHRSGDQYLNLSNPAEDDEEWKPMQDESAAILGIHNIAIAVPQIVAALGCAVVFKMSEFRGMENGTAWVFRVSGCAALMAAWMTRHL
jgi:solute carrier family 45 protein 1/2/4